MKSLFKLFCLAFLVLIGANSRAQIVYSLVEVAPVDSVVDFDSELRLTAMLSVSQGGNYNGTLRIGYQSIHSGSATNPDTLDNYLDDVSVQGSIPVDVDTIVIPVTPAYFIDGGGHTVIVWPIVDLPAGTVDIDSTILTNIIVTSWLKQEELETEKQAHIFPVPATDYLLLEKPEGTATIDILDIQGRVVMALFSNETQIRIPLSQLPVGNYYLRYSSGKHSEIHPFIRQ